MITVELPDTSTREHGTRAKYVVEQCRCPDCETANRDYNRDLAKAHLYGRFHGLIDATPTRVHLMALQAAGVGYRAAAKAAGISATTAAKLLDGRTRRVRPGTATAVLAVDYPPYAPGRLIAARPARRRARALVANGWPVAQLAARSGIDRQVLDRLVTGDWELTTARTAYAVLHLYEQLWDVTPPASGGSTWAKARARQFGWAVPMDLDDDAVDDDALTDAELADYRSANHPLSEDR